MDDLTEDGKGDEAAYLMLCWLSQQGWRRAISGKSDDQRKCMWILQNAKLKLLSNVVGSYLKEQGVHMWSN